MDLGLEELAAWFEAHRDEQHLVLAVVIATGGSTYRKAGAMVLIAADGSHAGLISGGCLEGDLVQRAAEVFADGQARRHSYDLNDDPELLMGLGLGCGGDIHLLLQRLDRADGFGVLPGAFAAHRRGVDSLLASSAEVGIDDRADAVREAAAGHRAGGAGVEVEEMMKAVRIKVLRDTAQRQIPWVNTSMVVNFMFNPGTAPQAAGYAAGH